MIQAAVMAAVICMVQLNKLAQAGAAMHRQAGRRVVADAHRQSNCPLPAACAPLSYLSLLLVLRGTVQLSGASPEL